MLAQWPNDSFSRRDLHQRARGRFPRAGALDTPLALLEEHGYVRAIPLRSDANGKAGRPPGPRYEINLAARTQNPQNSQNRQASGDFEYFGDFERREPDESEMVELLFRDGSEAA